MGQPFERRPCPQQACLQQTSHFFVRPLDDDFAAVSNFQPEITVPETLGTEYNPVSTRTALESDKIFQTGASVAPHTAGCALLACSSQCMSCVRVHDMLCAAWKAQDRENFAKSWLMTALSCRSACAARSLRPTCRRAAPAPSSRRSSARNEVHRVKNSMSIERRQECSVAHRQAQQAQRETPQCQATKRSAHSWRIKAENGSKRTWKLDQKVPESTHSAQSIITQSTSLMAFGAK